MTSLPSSMYWVSIHSEEEMIDDVTSFLYGFGEFPQFEGDG